MKSEKAKEFLRTKQPGDIAQYEISRWKAERAVEIAEQEMADNACRLFEQFMSGVFTGNTPKKMAQEFKRKLMER